MAAIQKPGVGPYGPPIIFATCTLGFLVGGVLDHWLTGSGRSFGAFGAAFGMTIGGLVGSMLVEFVLPFGLAILLLEGGAAKPAPAVAPPAPGLPPLPPEEQLGFAGRMVQAAVVLLALLAAAAAFGWGLGPIAATFGVSSVLVAAVLLLAGMALVGIAVVAGAALARQLDLTVA